MQISEMETCSMKKRHFSNLILAVCMALLVLFMDISCIVSGPMKDVMNNFMIFGNTFPFILFFF